MNLLNTPHIYNKVVFLGRGEDILLSTIQLFSIKLFFNCHILTQLIDGNKQNSVYIFQKEEANITSPLIV